MWLVACARRRLQLYRIASNLETGSKDNVSQQSEQAFVCCQPMSQN